MLNPSKAQRAARARAITLADQTGALVVPRKVSEWIDAGQFAKARAYLERARKVWGADPEITRAESLIAFLKP